MMRTERIWIEANPELDDLCQLSRKFWNEANGLAYQYQRFGVKYKDWGLSKALRRGSLLWISFPTDYIPEYITDYELMKSWKAFFVSLKDWKAHPQKYKAKPEPPGFLSYKLNRGRRSLPFRDRLCKIKDGELIIAPRSLNWHFETRLPDGNVNLVRFLPKRGKHYLMFVTYDDVEKGYDLDNSRAIGIDLGMKNLVTIANNFGAEPIAIPGGELIDYLKRVGRERDRIRSEYDRRNRYIPDKRKHIRQGGAMDDLLTSLERKKYQAVRTVASKVIDYCIQYNVSKISLGYNELWKHDIEKQNRMTSWWRRMFTSVAHHDLALALEEKAARAGIELIKVDEAYTSRTSFFDNEDIPDLGSNPTHLTGVRKQRSFLRANGQMVHADLNGALNILRKGYPQLDMMRSYPQPRSLKINLGLADSDSAKKT